MPLTLRPLAPDDYAVFHDGHPVGRIRIAAERRAQVWMWNVTIPHPGAPGGTAADLEEAKAAFREAWSTFKAAIGEVRLAEALELAQNARDRRPQKSPPPGAP
jgi:hypothetical protein